MIHRVVLAGIERFLGLLLEHHAGLLPLWLAPVQVKLIPVSDAVKEYALEVAEYLKKRGLRTELDDRNETVRYKIREAELEKVPCIAVVGEKEAAARSVSVRRRNRSQETFDLHALAESLFEEASHKRLP